MAGGLTTISNYYVLQFTMECYTLKQEDNIENSILTGEIRLIKKIACKRHMLIWSANKFM